MYKNRYGSGPLIFENACARAGNIFFFTENFLSVGKNRFLALKDRVCERFETKFHYFIATSY